MQPPKKNSIIEFLTGSLASPLPKFLDVVTISTLFLVQYIVQTAICAVLLIT